jgi:hypothetical protein
MALLPYDTATLLLLVAAAGAAGLARGFSGFGGALIFMPAASALITPAVAAPVLLVADNIMSSTLLPWAWARAGKREVAVMALGAFVGVPLGTLALNSGDPLLLRWVIAAMAVAMLLLLMSGWRYNRTPVPTVTVGVGAISGLFGGLAQLSGPPVVAYWLSGRTAHDGVRANIILFFAVTGVLTTVSYIAAGLLDVRALLVAALVGPSYGLGLFAGSKAFGMASEKTFRRLCFAMIAVSVLSSLPTWR